MLCGTQISPSKLSTDAETSEQGFDNRFFSSILSSALRTLADRSLLSTHNEVTNALSALANPECSSQQMTINALAQALNAPDNGVPVQNILTRANGDTDPTATSSRAREREWRVQKNERVAEMEEFSINSEIFGDEESSVSVEDQCYDNESVESNMDCDSDVENEVDNDPPPVSTAAISFDHNPNAQCEPRNPRNAPLNESGSVSCSRVGRLTIEKRLRDVMKKSCISQAALQEWDKLNGLPASHSKTMVNTSRSRQQLMKGIILKKWDGSPLISLDE